MVRYATDRRTLLKLAGTTVAAASISGCSELSSLGNSAPQYRDWVPADPAAEDRTGFAYMDTSAGGFDPEEIANASGLEADPDALAGFMLLYAGYGTGILTIGGGAGVLRNASLATLLPDALREDESADDGDSDDGDGSDGGNSSDDGSQSGETPEKSTIEGALVAGSALVLLGDIDVEELRSVTASQYEEVDERDGYSIFERSSGDDPAQFAAGDDAVVLPIGADSESVVETMLDTVSGDGDRLYNQDDMDWAIDTAGSGQLVYGSRDPEAAEADTDGFEFDLESLFESALPWDFQKEATGVVSSVGYEDGSITGEAALAYEQAEDVPEKGEIQNQLTPTSADDYEITVDETRVEISGTWEAVTDADQENSSN